MSSIRVLVVDDRPEVRLWIQEVLQKDPRFVVVAALPNCEDALRFIRMESPQAVTVRWPMSDGSSPSCVRHVSAQFATPVVAMVDADFARYEAQALRQGAVSAFLVQPDRQHRDYTKRCRAFCDHLAAMSKVHIIRRKLADGRTATDLTVASTPVDRVASSSGQIMALGIVASTGGPAAVCEILRKLPKDFLAPVLLVQHITSEFSQSFVDWLGGNISLPVRLAEHDEFTLPGTVYVAPPDYHMYWENRRILLRKGERECWQRPSGNVLFRSMAASGLPCIGVILTGLGEDGAQGLLALRESGAHTIAQSRQSCVVYGMPKAAVRLGAVDEEIGLERIGPRLLELAEASRVP